MVVRNKLYTLFDKYRKILESEVQKRPTVHPGNYNFLRGVKSKNEILDFYLKTTKWPSRLSKNRIERKLATRFENFVSKESATYDPRLRRLAMATGRTTNNKRKHDIQGFKKQILEFIETNGRVPTTSRKYETIEGESRLRNRLDYYTGDKNDMALLGQVYAADKCHKSGIPSKFRAIINEALNTKKPLIRMV